MLTLFVLSSSLPFPPTHFPFSICPFSFFAFFVFNVPIFPPVFSAFYSFAFSVIFSLSCHSYLHLSILHAHLLSFHSFCSAFFPPFFSSKFILNEVNHPFSQISSLHVFSIQKNVYGFSLDVPKYFIKSSLHFF